MTGHDLSREPRGIKRVVKAGEEHHGQEQHHAGVAQHLQHPQNFLLQGTLLAIDFGAMSAANVTGEDRSCLEAAGGARFSKYDK